MLPDASLKAPISSMRQLQSANNTQADVVPEVQAPASLLVFNGPRIRIGMHAAIPAASDIVVNPTSGELTFTTDTRDSSCVCANALCLCGVERL